MPTDTPSRLLMIGCGRMGGALLSGWQARKVPLDVTIADPNKPEQLPDAVSIDWVPSAEALPADYRPDVVLLAVKPQLLDKVMPALAERSWQGVLWLSVAAGKRTDYFAGKLGQDAAVIRIMPNTPALVGEGMSALFATKSTSEEQRTLAEKMMQAVGQALWLDEESQMDGFTGLAGSGPAYVFYMMEALTAAGIDAGLTEEASAKAAIQTVRGAAELAAQSENVPSELRQQVTSPGGTTAAGLEVLMDKTSGLGPLIKAVVLAAKKRAEALSD